MHSQLLKMTTSSPLLLLLLHLSSVLLIVFLVFRITRRLCYYEWKSTARSPPGSCGLPLIGETFEFLADNNSNKGFYHFVQTRRLRSVYYDLSPEVKSRLLIAWAEFKEFVTPSTQAQPKYSPGPKNLNLCQKKAQAIGSHVFTSSSHICYGASGSHKKLRQVIVDCVYGKCFKTNIFGKTHVFISGTDSAKVILGNDFVNFSKRYIRSMAELVGHESILCASHEQHKLIRNKLSSLVSTNSLSLLIGHFDESVVKMLSHWEQRGTIVVLEDALKITFNAMCKMLMSLESSKELEMMQKDVAQMCEAMLAVPLKLPWTRFYKGLKARTRIMDKLKEMIDARRKGLEYHEDLLQNLLKKEESPFDNVQMLTDIQIQENILTLIIAGQVTTASAMTWMVKYLDENQEVQDTIRVQQIKIANEASPCSSLTLEDLNEMSNASKVVKESLRMASVVPWFPRVALNDCEVEGFKIKKGWIVNIDARAIHLDPVIYNEPTKFNPWRFDDDSKPYSFLAFGTGGRTCLGMNLAKAMIIIFLHRLVTIYRWEVINSDPGLEKRAIFSRLRSGCPIRVTPLAP